MSFKYTGTGYYVTAGGEKVLLGLARGEKAWARLEYYRKYVGKIYLTGVVYRPHEKGGSYKTNWLVDGTHMQEPKNAKSLALLGRYKDKDKLLDPCPLSTQIERKKGASGGGGIIVI